MNLKCRERYEQLAALEKDMSLLKLDVDILKNSRYYEAQNKPFELDKQFIAVKLYWLEMRLEIIENENYVIEDTMISHLKKCINELKRILRKELSTVELWKENGCACAADCIELNKEKEKEDILIQIRKLKSEWI